MVMTMSYENVSLKMDEKVKNWVRKKGRTLTISTKANLGCCIGHEDVDISYKEPKSNNYSLFQEEDISIYLEKGIPLKSDEIKLSLMGVSIFTTIHVGGLAIV